MDSEQKELDDKSSKQLLVLLGTCIVFILLSTSILSGLGPNQPSQGAQGAYGKKGTLDFVQYWASFQLIREHSNPYDAELLLEKERALGMPHDDAIMMWSPPWLPILLSPVLSMEFSHSAELWLICSILMYVFSTALLYKANDTNRSYRTHLLTALFFFPIWENIIWGQSSIIVLLGLAFFAYFISRNAFYLAGASLVLLSIKPHLLSVFAIACLFWIIKEKKYQLFVGLGIACISLITPLLLYHPEVLGFWLETLQNPGAAGSVSIFDWKVATLSSAIRSLIQTPDQQPPRWPMWAIPAITCSLFTLFLFLKRPWIRQGSWLAVTVAVSVLIAPYGWLYDQVLLLPLQLQLIDRNSGKNGSKLVLLLAVTLQITLLVTALDRSSSQYSFWWFPSALVALFFLSELLNRETAEDD